MNNEIFELSEEEVVMITGSGEIDPPQASGADQYPEIVNEPPV